MVDRSQLLCSEDILLSQDFFLFFLAEGGRMLSSCPVQYSENGLKILVKKKKKRYELRMDATVHVRINMQGQASCSPVIFRSKGLRLHHLTLFHYFYELLITQKSGC